MKASDKVDAGRVDLLRTELQLSGVKLVCSALAATADKEGSHAARFLAAPVEQELAHRGQRRIARHFSEARLPQGQTLDAFDFDAVQMITKAQVQALASRRRTAGKRHQSIVVRYARRLNVASLGGSQPRARRKRMARLLR